MERRSFCGLSTFPRCTRVDLPLSARNRRYVVLWDDPLPHSVDQVQIRATAEPERSPSLRRFQPQLGVENLDVPLAQKAVDCLQRRDFRQPQLLRQPARNVQLTAAPLAR